MMLQVVLPDSKANFIVYMAMNILSEIVIVCVDHCTQSRPEVFYFRLAAMENETESLVS